MRSLSQELIERQLAPSPREANLPVWAQDKLGDLRRHMAELRRELERLVAETDPEGSQAVAAPHTVAPIGLGEDPLVMFRLVAPHGAAEAHVSVEFGRLRIRTEGGLVDVRPDCSNTITVGVSRQ